MDLALQIGNLTFNVLGPSAGNLNLDIQAVSTRVEANTFLLQRMARVQLIESARLCEVEDSVWNQAHESFFVIHGLQKLTCHKPEHNTRAQEVVRRMLKKLFNPSSTPQAKKSDGKHSKKKGKQTRVPEDTEDDEQQLAPPRPLKVLRVNFFDAERPVFEVEMCSVSDSRYVRNTFNTRSLDERKETGQTISNCVTQATRVRISTLKVIFSHF